MNMTMGNKTLKIETNKIPVTPNITCLVHVSYFPIPDEIVMNF